jgi:hypothetical protein
VVPVVEAAHLVVVEKQTTDAAVSREGARLWLDLLRREHSGDGGEQRIAVHELEVARQLFDAVNVAAPLDLNGDGCPARVTRQNVDGPDRRHVLAAHEGVSVTHEVDLFSEELLQVRLNPILLQAGVFAEVVARVVQDFVDRDDEEVGRLGLNNLPDFGDADIRLVCVWLDDADGARRAHPVERLVRECVGMHEHATVGFEHEQSRAEGKVRAEAARIVH